MTEQGRSGIIGPAHSVPMPVRTRIGDLLVARGLITPEQAARVVDYGAERNARFGEAAIALGFITPQQRDEALAAQLEVSSIAQPAIAQPDVFAFSAPASEPAEDIRALRNALTLRWFQHPEGARTLAVIGPERFEGRSLTAANLAVSFAQVGVRTLLIDADMRHPRQHALFGIENRTGLSSYLNGQGDGGGHYYVPGLEALTIVPVGTLPPSPQELLLRPTLNALIAQVSLNFEVVLIDTPAASVGSDYQVVAKAARGALLVTSQSSSRIKRTARMLDTCEDIGVKIVGGALAKKH